jgi:multiple sugar transport system permease protein
MIFLLFLMLYPLAMAFWNAFKSDLGYLYTRWYPTIPLRFRNFVVAFPRIWRYILNTLIVAVFGTAGMLFVSSLAAYTFARMKFFGREVIYMGIIALMKFVLIIPIITGGSVFGTFLLRAFFSSIPEDIFEAARIDGAREFRVYFSICIPLCMPILGTLTIMQINSIWNDYMWPMVTQQDHNNLTISAGLIVKFVREFSTNYPAQFAGYLLSSVPLILLFIFANKYYIEGLTSSAIKL